MITEEQKELIRKKVKRIRKQKHMEQFQKFLQENIDSYGYYEEPNLEKYKDIKRWTEDG